MALKARRVLFISYNGMLDPLGQNQVIPYLRELAGRGVRFTLLSFERAAALGSDHSGRYEELSNQLASQNIEWHWLRYHKKLSLPATAYDVIAGVRYAQSLVKRNQIEMVHARGHIPATIALALKKRLGLKMIFDVRGLMAEEYVDAGHWRKGGVPYRLTKTMERRALAVSDAVVTLTQKIWPLIKDWDGLRGRSVVHEVIPCCADLELFKFSSEDRVRRRAELDLTDRFTIIYSGSIDGWYLTKEMADFFAEVLRKLPDSCFLWLTPSRHDRIKRLMQERGITPRNYVVLAAAPRDVPSYLCAGDAGLAFIKPCFSKLASSPTKNAEYLACGLPLIINAGIGDSDALVTSEMVGVLINEFTGTEYSGAVDTIVDLTRDPGETRKQAREVAERLFDLCRVGAERYARLYERVLNVNN
jgi:glycosyltransferase involved in cell wall biosynthesis